MRKRPEWDVEVTYDATYDPRGGRPFVARVYPHGSRTMAYMVETAETENDVLVAVAKRIADYRETPRRPLLTTFVFTDDGTIIP